MAYETIKYEVADNILTLSLNRPDKLNAFDKADADDNVRAIIVTGEGRAFCAGADLSAGAKTFDYAEREDRPEKQGTPVKPNGEIDWSHESVRDGGGRLTLRIFESLKPVIGAINGPAVGVGVTMQLPMDIRLASDNAKFGFVFARRGIAPDGAASWFLPNLVGRAQALEWCRSRRGAEGRPCAFASQAGRSSPRRPRNREGNRGQHGTGFRRADAPDALAPARCGSSDGSAQDR